MNRIAISALGTAALLSACANLSPAPSGAPSPSSQPAGGTMVRTTNASQAGMPASASPEAAALRAALAPRANASAPELTTAGTAAPTATPTAVSAPPSPPPRPFATVVQGAKREDGFFPTWRKDDKVWIEIAPGRWGQPFYFSLNRTHGIGEGPMFGNQMGGFMGVDGGYVASLRRNGETGVQLVAHNTGHLAINSDAARAMLDRAYSDSLVGQAAVVSRPHPETNAVLIEANALLVNDFPMGAAQLERQYRQAYAFDPRNSAIGPAPNSEGETGFQVRAHYSLGRVAVPTPGSPAPAPSLPGTVPDGRSLFLGYYYGLSRLPEPMRPRVADSRVGYFATSVADYSDPNRRKPVTRFIQRWRLEKQDPTAAMSPPRQPIVYWLDRNIPPAYRATVTAGVLEWNKAFERIGYKDAIVVRQQGADPAVDTSATRFASIRWVAGGGIPFAGRGPSKVDPRTGEILDADIEINEEITRIYSSRAGEDPPRPMGSELGMTRGAFDCDYGDSRMMEASFGLDLLVARGELALGTPAAQRWVKDAIKDLITHEVGHTLGLRHNFRGSMAVPEDKVADAAWGAEHGISASVMDYNALNMAPAGERQGQYWMVTLGSYDYWAIEYGYKQLAPADEHTALTQLLARSGEAGLAYATDEDAGYGAVVEGVDPEVSRRDLSSNPLGFYRSRFAVVQELWQRLQSRPLADGTPYDQLRRNFERGFAILGQVSELTARFVGGLSVRRDVAGGRGQPMQPVDAKRQRQALELLNRNLFEVDAFRFKPEFLGKLLPDMDERMANPEAPGNKLDYSVAQRVLAIQREALSQLMRDSVATRLVNAREQMPRGDGPLTLAQLYGSVQQSIWRELQGKDAIPLMRRNLQREHLRLMVDAVARGSARAPADARSLQREFAQRLLAQMRGAVAARGAGDGMVETRAHLNESIALLEAALKAQVTRSLS